MMITSRTPFSSTVPPKTCGPGAGPRTWYSTTSAGRSFPSGHEMPAKEQFSLAVVGVVRGLVRPSLARPDEVDDLLAARNEELRDQAPVAAPPERLGAHEARRGLRERGGERLLPLRPPHPCGVAPERRSADAGEPFLAGLAGEAPAELDG